MEENVVCLICNSKNIKFLFDVKTGYWNSKTNESPEIGKCFVCTDCGGVFKDVNRLPVSLEEFYKELTIDYYANLRNSHTLHDAKMQKIIYAQKTKGILLDVGCGTGGFLESMNNDWEKWGIEPSPVLKEILEKRGIKAVTGEFLQAEGLPELYFDIISFYDVIEHVTKPVEHLKKIYGLLKNDGIVIFTTPNKDSLMARFSGRYWRHFSPIGHIAFYSPETLTTLLEKNGYIVTNIETYDYKLSFFQTHINFISCFIKFIIKWPVINISEFIFKATHKNILKYLPAFNKAIYFPWYYDYFVITAKKK